MLIRLAIALNTAILGGCITAPASLPLSHSAPTSPPHPHAAQERSFMPDPIDLESLFAKTNNFYLCDIVYGAIENHYGYTAVIRNTPKVLREHRVIHYVWATTGFLEVNGFSYYWGVDIDHPFYAHAFDAIEAQIQANNIRDALKIVTDKNVLGDYHRVGEFFGSPEMEQAAADPFQRVLFGAHDEIETKLAAYIRKRPQSFDAFEEVLFEKLNLALKLQSSQ